MERRAQIAVGKQIKILSMHKKCSAHAAITI